MTPINAKTGQRLDKILARDIAIQWAEAIALVQGACRQLLVTGASGFPTSAQIMLYAEGTVVALATTDQPPVRAAGHLLASLLGDDVPVRLRLLAFQATGANGAYASLQEFSKALSYFERPDPAVLLRELHRRAAAALPVAPPAEAPAAAKATRVRRWLVVMAAAILVCLMAWFVGRRLGGIRAVAGVAQEAAGEAKHRP